jgi:catechol 2,3-dioxygenase-like lactoylglutathione lyase family enzyme
MVPYVDPTEQLVVEIFARDLKRSIGFYRRLGFELIREEPAFAELVWQGHRLFIEELPNLPPPLDFPQANMRIMVPNVDDYWEIVTRMRIPVIKPIGDREYGLRDFTVTDPDGFGLRFGTRLPDVRRSA